MSEPKKTLALDLSDDGAFAAIDEATWRALVEDGLKGADFEKRLVKLTADAIAVKPLYQQKDGGQGSGLPGQAPFTRGAKAASALSRPWEVTLKIEHPDLKIANEQILEGLEGGVSHLDLVLCDQGQPGLSLNTPDDLDVLLAGVDLALIFISVSGGERSGEIAGWIARRGGPKVVQGGIGLDPLGTLATRGGLTSPLEESLQQAGFYGLKTSEMTDKFRTLNVDMRGYDAAGASPALSLGIAMATGTAYLRALEAQGLSIDDAAGQIYFTLTSDTDLFMTIAKLRAARTLWSRVVSASGGSAKAGAMAMHVETATSMMTRRDAHTNILRTAIAGFGAVLGGAGALSILPFTDALGLPGELARRVARNIHVLLAEEANLGRVMDPAGGSYALESLSANVAARGWANFQEIEGEGGMARALISGTIEKHLVALNEVQAKALASRKIPVTGVSEFPDINEAKVEARPRAIPAATKPDFAVSLKALTPRRLAQAFEALRDNADAAPTRPIIFLATLGSLANFTARAGFAQNLFEAGGFNVVTGDGGTDAKAIAAAFKASGASTACLCSSDPLYKEHGANVGAALGKAGAKLVFLAGAPGALKEPLAAAGVKDFIYVGADVLAALEKAQSAAGVSS